ncbi:UPF0764 protein C16orf89 [Diorhabda carinulata]|uniref:UPF0764 protein C16orf89 n=1 Tax=Diorhabda carinulata TaxID=1163345 RepID=UPI0025A254AE|nr:UPF0764 protein C16orf89 [Diorhabda carinulata]
MLLMVISLILITILFKVAFSDPITYIEVEKSLEKVLNFMNENVYQFGFDGFFGLTLAQSQLAKILDLPISRYIYYDVKYLIEQCQRILIKAQPMLPNDPSYMITFANKLLDFQKWSQTLPNNITFGELPNLGIYVNWSPTEILKNKRAIYKGVETNLCLRELLELSTDQNCYVSSICKEMMLDTYRIDTGYLLTHRLLYMQIKRLQGCLISGDLIKTKDYIKLFCSYILKEAKTNEYLKFPYHDIFLEQVVLCGIEGYGEFFKEKWLDVMLKWQNSHGCYESIPIYKIRNKRTSHTINYGCSDHATGLGAAALALYFKYLFIPV